jgi:3-hydroxybutyryl-CoA dehydratase
MNVRPRDRFSSQVTLTPTSVAEFARGIGDLNPVHHDPEYAAGTRFKRPIASGTQTTALLMALTATHFSQRSAMVGLEFWFRFRRAVFADETIRLEWLVISVRPHPRLGGNMVDLRGRVLNQAGETAVGAKGRVLVTEHL